MLQVLCEHFVAGDKPARKAKLPPDAKVISGNRIDLGDQICECEVKHVLELNLADCEQSICERHDLRLLKKALRPLRCRCKHKKPEVVPGGSSSKNSGEKPGSSQENSGPDSTGEISLSSLPSDDDGSFEISMPDESNDRDSDSPSSSDSASSILSIIDSSPSREFSPSRERSPEDSGKKPDRKPKKKRCRKGSKPDDSKTGNSDNDVIQQSPLLAFYIP